MVRLKTDTWIKKERKKKELTGQSCDVQQLTKVQIAYVESDIVMCGITRFQNFV